MRGFRDVEDDRQCDGRSKATSFAFRDDFFAEDISIAVLLLYGEAPETGVKCGLEST